MSGGKSDMALVRTLREPAYLFERRAARPAQILLKISTMEQEILSELATALEDHGAPSEIVRRVREARRLSRELMADSYAELQKVGAHPWLLATIGSWRDGLTDGEVLEQLKALNTGTFDFQVIASTSTAGKQK